MLGNADSTLPLADESCEHAGVHPHLSLFRLHSPKSSQQSAPLTNQSNHDRLGALIAA